MNNTVRTAGVGLHLVFPYLAHGRDSLNVFGMQVLFFFLLEASIPLSRVLACGGEMG